MWLGKTAHFIGIIARPAARGMSAIAAGMLVAMMILTGADVTLRYIFNRPILGSFEITEFMMAITVALGLAYCALQKAHVRSDVVVSRLPQWTQAALNSIASLAFLGLFILITWQSIYRAQAMIDTRLTSSVLYIPKFPFVFVVTAGSALLCLVLLRDLFDYLHQAVKR